MDTDEYKTIAGRARHSVRAGTGVLTDGGQRTARPTNQSVFIRVHPWLKLKSSGAASQLCQRIEHRRIVWKQCDGVTDAGAQPA